MDSEHRSFEIRPARAEDATCLSQLLAELGHPSPPLQVAERLATLTAAGGRVWVAAHGPAPIGLITTQMTLVLHRPTPVGRLTALVVAEQFRGRGIGRALVAVAEQYLAASGCALIEVTSNTTRADAHAFYRRLGYAVTSFRFYKAVGSAHD